jgi:hypothetical protein
MRRLWRSLVPALAILLTIASASVSAGCDRDDDGWQPQAQFAPSKRPAFGARVTDGRLQIWTAPRCLNVREVHITFGLGGPELVLTAAGADLPTVERLTVGGPYPGLTVSQAPPADFDWRTPKLLFVNVESTPKGFAGTTEMAEILGGSAAHPDDTFWFDGVGWLNPAEVAAQEGTKFLGICTPDPAKK